ASGDGPSQTLEVYGRRVHCDLILLASPAPAASLWLVAHRLQLAAPSPAVPAWLAHVPPLRLVDPERREGFGFSVLSVALGEKG
ncbi:unnamed protein product, partial [Urochloa humidicola]